DQHAADLPVSAAQRLQPAPARKREPLALRPWKEVAQVQGEVRAALLRLLPAVKRLVPDPERLDRAVRRLLTGRPLRQGRGQFGGGKAPVTFVFIQPINDARSQAGPGIIWIMQAPSAAPCPPRPRRWPAGPDSGRRRSAAPGGGGRPGSRPPEAGRSPPR